MKTRVKITLLTALLLLIICPGALGETEGYALYEDEAGRFSLPYPARWQVLDRETILGALKALEEGGPGSLIKVDSGMLKDYLAAMEEAEATVRVHDPFVDTYPGVEISYDLDGTLAEADAVVIFTAHHHYTALDPARVKELSGRENPVIVDGRNVVDPDAFIRAGFIYKGSGRGDKNSHPIRR